MISLNEMYIKIVKKHRVLDLWFAKNGGSQANLKHFSDYRSFLSKGFLLVTIQFPYAWEQIVGFAREILMEIICYVDLLDAILWCYKLNFRH